MRVRMVSGKRARWPEAFHSATAERKSFHAPGTRLDFARHRECGLLGSQPMSAGTPAISSSSLTWRVTALSVLAILAAAAVLLVPRHEPWFDEVQAWLLARDASRWDILWKYARYEGSPSLWHLVLAWPARAGAPPVALNAVSSGLALCGAALLLFKSPFPRLLRVLLPAGFFFFYQYGIVARSYALLIPLLWLVAVLYPQRFARPWRYVIALMILSQVSLHGSWIAGALMVIFVGEAWWCERWPQARLGTLVLAFAANTAFIIAQLWPRPDLYSPPWVADRDRIWQVLRDMWLDSVLPWPWAAFVVLLVACLFFYTRGVLLSYLLTTAGLLALFAFRFFSVWHQGMLYALLVLHAWLAWASPRRRRIVTAPDECWPALATGVLTATAAVHVWWSVMAGWNDWKYPYSGSREAAQYLRAQGLDRQRIHIFKFSTCAILLYLDRNPFANVAPFMPGAFWVWTKEIFAGQTAPAVVEGDPPWVLIGAQMLPKDEPKSAPLLPGYAIERVFPGHMFWKDGYYQSDSYYLYRRIAPPAGG